MSEEEIETKAKELVELGAHFSKLLAKKAVREGKYEKCKTIALRNIADMSSSKEGATTWPCHKCRGYLIKRINRLTKESFMACTNYPACTYTQKDDITTTDKTLE